MRRASLELAAIVVALAACGAPSLPPSSPSALLGAAAPSFERASVAGAVVKVGADEAPGRAAVLEFGSVTCAPCKRTLPLLDRVARAHPDVLVVAVDEDERAADARALADALGLALPVVHDREQILAGRYRVRELPATFAIGKDGKVAWFGDGAESEATLEAVMAAIAR